MNAMRKGPQMLPTFIPKTQKCREELKNLNTACLLFFSIVRQSSIKTISTSDKYLQNIMADVKRLVWFALNCCNGLHSLGWRALL